MHIDARNYCMKRERGRMLSSLQSVAGKPRPAVRGEETRFHLSWEGCKTRAQKLRTWDMS